jgi:hypothetical protein
MKSAAYEDFRRHNVQTLLPIHEQRELTPSLTALLGGVASPENQGKATLEAGFVEGKQAAYESKRDELLRAGRCCGEGCRDCPYEPRHFKGSTKIRVREKDKKVVESVGTPQKSAGFPMGLTLLLKSSSARSAAVWNPDLGGFVDNPSYQDSRSWWERQGGLAGAGGKTLGHTLGAAVFRPAQFSMGMLNRALDLPRNAGYYKDHILTGRSDREKQHFYNPYGLRAHDDHPSREDMLNAQRQQGPQGFVGSFRQAAGGHVQAADREARGAWGRTLTTARGWGMQPFSWRERQKDNARRPGDSRYRPGQGYQSADSAYDPHATSPAPTFRERQRGDSKGHYTTRPNQVRSTQNVNARPW